MKTNYNQKMIDYLIDNYKGKGTKELAEEMSQVFGMKIKSSSIQNKKSSLKRQGYEFEPVPNAGRFIKGQQSFNKGLKWDEFMSKEGQENSRTTTFKKGNIPVNHKPVGSERINVDGYVEIKVAEPNKWDLKHRVVYRQLHGEIPKDGIITFLDSNPLNLDPDNLILINLNQNLILNKEKLRSEYPEITKSSIFIAKIMEKGGFRNSKK